MAKATQGCCQGGTSNGHCNLIMDSRDTRLATTAHGSLTLTTLDHQPGASSSQGGQENIPPPPPEEGVLRLRGGPRSAPRVQWNEDVVDNEGSGKKKSKSALPASSALLCSSLPLTSRQFAAYITSHASLTSRRMSRQGASTRASTSTSTGMMANRVQEDMGVRRAGTMPTGTRTTLSPRAAISPLRAVSQRLHACTHIREQ